VSVRVVLDTNVVVSALVFETGRLAWLRQAWMAGDLRVLVSPATTAELLRVFAYPKFKLGTDEIEALLGDLLPYAEVVDVPAHTQQWPGLVDPEDAMFLELAAAGRAAFVVTGDRALLGATPPPDCRIVEPAEFRTQVGGVG